jgi:hypothetical protein
MLTAPLKISECIDGVRGNGQKEIIAVATIAKGRTMIGESVGPAEGTL